MIEHIPLCRNRLALISLAAAGLLALLFIALSIYPPPPHPPDF